MHNHNPKNAPITPPFATPHEAVCVKVCPRQVPKAHHTLNTVEPGTGHCARRTPPPCMSAPLSENLPFDEDEPRHRSAYSMHAVHTVMGSPFRISSARPPSCRTLLWNAAPAYDATIQRHTSQCVHALTEQSLPQGLQCDAASDGQHAIGVHTIALGPAAHCMPACHTGPQRMMSLPCRNVLHVVTCMLAPVRLRTECTECRDEMFVQKKLAQERMY